MKNRGIIIEKKYILRNAIACVCLCVLFMLPSSVAGQGYGWESLMTYREASPIFHTPSQNNMISGWSRKPFSTFGHEHSMRPSIWSQESNSLSIYDNLMLYREPFSTLGYDNPLLRAIPGFGAGQKEVVPVSDGFWIVAILSVVYGIVCRIRKRSGQPDVG